MQEAVARLYARIIEFVQNAICFYKQGKVVHSIRSIFQPWSLSFQDHYDAILNLSNRVKDLASLAAKAELRDTHLEVIKGRKDLDRTSTEIVMLRSEVQGLKTLVESRFSQQQLWNSSMSLHSNLTRIQWSYVILVLTDWLQKRCIRTFI